MTSASKIPRWRTRALRWLALGAVALATPATAQTWVVRAGPDSLAAVAAPSARVASTIALDALARRGYGLATVTDTLASSAGGTLLVTLGPRLVVDDVTIVGTERLAREDVTTGWATRRGRPYAPSILDADLALAIERYASAGFADARFVARTQLVPADTTVRVAVTVDVVEGSESLLAGVELVGARRASRDFATRVTGLTSGTPLGRFRPDAVRQSLDATGLYTTVGEPTLAREADGRVTIRVPVEPGPPGAFDLVVGVLPPAGGAPARVVGSGRLELVDPLGGGETVRVSLVRNPGLVSSLDATVRDPFVLGTPLSLDASFAGESRDSTFSRQSVRGAVGWRVAPGLSVQAVASREAILPGRAASSDGVVRIRRSTALFAGAGVQYQAVDRSLDPRRGLLLALTVESGRRRRAAAADSLASVSPRQQRLLGTARGYLPLVRRLGAVAGVDARVLVTGRDADGQAVAADEGELFRIGGASSLRGYDEDAFLGSAVGRALVELRWSLDAVSAAFVFTDVGYVVRPDLPDRPGSRRTRPGYGVGLRLGTALGPVTATYALNPALPIGRGKLHLGLSVGL